MRKPSSRVTKSQLQMDANYIQSIRDRFDRAHARIDTLTLEKAQLRARVKLLDEAFESLNEKYLKVCSELEALKGTNMEKKTAVDIAIEYLRKAQAEVYELAPPPYEFPSDNGRIAQLLSDSLNMAEIIKQKSNEN